MCYISSAEILSQKITKIKAYHEKDFGHFKLHSSMLLFTEKNKIFVIQSCMQEILRWLFQTSDVIWQTGHYGGLSNIDIPIKMSYCQFA